jgi:hypothetical protein
LLFSSRFIAFERLKIERTQGNWTAIAVFSKSLIVASRCSSFTVRPSGYAGAVETLSNFRIAPDSVRLQMHEPEHKPIIPTDSVERSRCLARSIVQWRTQNMSLVGYFLSFLDEYCLLPLVCSNSDQLSVFCASHCAHRSGQSQQPQSQQQGLVSYAVWQCRAVTTRYGKGIRTSAKFYCPKNKVVGSFGPVVLLSDAEYAESDWDNYGVAWDLVKRLTAVPKCSRSELKEFGPLINTSSNELGERNNLRFVRSVNKGGRDGKEQPSVDLVSTRAIRGNEALLVAYGRSFSCAPRSLSTSTKRRDGFDLVPVPGARIVPNCMRIADKLSSFLVNVLVLGPNPEPCTVVRFEFDSLLFVSKGAMMCWWPGCMLNGYVVYQRLCTADDLGR